MLSFHVEAEDTAPSSKSLVTVISYYDNLSAPFQKIKIKGSGFLVWAFNKQFVVTASHVSQGKDRQIFFGNKKLNILGDLYEGKNDLHVIEVEPVLESYPMMLRDDNFIEWQKEESVRSRTVDQFNFVLLNDWVKDPNLALDNDYSKMRVDDVHCTLNCVSLRSDTIMQPGSSGSPLLTRIPEEVEWKKTTLPFDSREKLPFKRGKYFLRGLTIKRERFFAQSAFVPVDSIVSAIKNYMQRPAKTSNFLTWNMSGSLMFRNIGERIHESAVISAAVGNSVSMDGGNSVSMDGGDLALMNEDAPSEVFADVTSFPVVSGKESMNWLFITRDETDIVMAAMWFDIESYSAFQGLMFNVGLKEEEDGFYLKFLLHKIPRPGSGLSLPGLTPTEDSLNVEVPTDEGTKLVFSLNIRGAYCKTLNNCAKRFQPIIEVPDSTGQIYLVDLRGFIFLNPELSESEIFKDPKTLSLNKLQKDRLQTSVFVEEMDKIRLRFRKKRAVKSPLRISEGKMTKKTWQVIFN